MPAANARVIRLALAGLCLWSGVSCRVDYTADADSCDGERSFAVADALDADAQSSDAPSPCLLPGAPSSSESGRRARVLPVSGRLALPIKPVLLKDARSPPSLPPA